MLKKNKILILGGGFAGLYVARQLQNQLRKDEAEIILVDKKNYFLFTPLLHEVAAATISEEQPVDSILSLVSSQNFSWFQGTVKEIRFNENKVILEDFTEIEYDFLVLALGSESTDYGIPGVQEYAVPLKDLNNAVTIRGKLIDMFDKAAREIDAKRRAELLNIVIVGGGPTGVELAGEISDFEYEVTKHYFSDVKRVDVSLSLIHVGDELIPMAHEKLRRWTKLTLQSENWNILLGVKVVNVEADQVCLEDGRTIKSNLTIWAGGVKPVGLNYDVNLKLDQTGRILVDKNLRILDIENAFALGDIANGVGEYSWPMLAQAATQGSKVLAGNVLVQLRNIGKMKEFKFSSKGFLASLGRWKAVGDIAGIKVKGPFVWFVWHVVYVSKFISSSKRVKLVLEWILQVFVKRDISQLHNDI